jgi:hypothetical protein
MCFKHVCNKYITERNFSFSINFVFGYLNGQCVPGAVYPGVEQQGHEANCSPLSSAKVKNT